MEGWDKAGRQLAIFLFPLVFSLTRLDISTYRKRLLAAFSITCILTVVYLYVDALHTIIHYQYPLSALITPAFINHNFSLPIDLHATYFSMYLFIAFLYLLDRLWVPATWWRKLLIAAGCLLLFAGLLQAGSKAVCIALIIAAIFILPLKAQQWNKALRYSAAGLAATLLVLALIYNNAILRRRYVTDLRDDLRETGYSHSVPESRRIRWETALQLVAHAPVAGYGTGSEMPLLQEQYFTHQLYVSYLTALNTHNQYLSIALSSGIAGVLLFCGTLVYAFVIAFRRKDTLFLSFIVLIGIVSFSENILSVNKGIFFYAYFFSLFLFSESHARHQE